MQRGELVTYLLYKIGSNRTYQRTSFDDLDNKAFWCQHGERQELAFVELMKKIKSPFTVSIHPEKANNPYHPDLLVQKKGTDTRLIGEVKIKNSPLFMAESYNVAPQHALTMDLKDSFNYLRWLREGVDIIIFIWVKWEAHKMQREGDGKKYEVLPMRGIWVTSFSKLRNFEERERPGIHWYREHFRKPTVHSETNDPDWFSQLKDFEPRLLQDNGVVKNITSKGYMNQGNVKYPSGHSSGSYVFDLQNEDVFDRIVYSLDE